MEMKTKLYLTGLLFLPLVVVIFLLLLPLILIFGLIVMIFGRRVSRSFIKTASFQWQGASQEPEQNEDVVLDAEVIQSETVGEDNDISGRALR